MAEPLTIILLGLAVIFLAGITQGLSGFGFALVSVPIMLLVLPPKVIVPIILIHATLIPMFLLYASKAHVEFRRILPLIIASLIGMPLGTYLLLVLDIGLLKISIGAIIALFALVLLKGFRMRVKHEKFAVPPVGFISGLLNGSTSMSGPPVVLFLANQETQKHNFRANLLAYFLVLNLLTLPTYFFTGLITAEVIRYAIIFLPAMILGGFAGMKLHHKIDEKLFKKIVLVIVLVSGMLSIYSGLNA